MFLGRPPPPAPHPTPKNGREIGEAVSSGSSHGVSIGGAKLWRHPFCPGIRPHFSIWPGGKQWPQDHLLRKNKNHRKQYKYYFSDFPKMGPKALMNSPSLGTPADRSCQDQHHKRMPPEVLCALTCHLEHLSLHHDPKECAHTRSCRILQLAGEHRSYHGNSHLYPLAGVTSTTSGPPRHPY